MVRAGEAFMALCQPAFSVLEANSDNDEAADYAKAYEVSGDFEEVFHLFAPF